MVKIAHILCIAITPLPSSAPVRLTDHNQRVPEFILSVCAALSQQRAAFTVHPSGQASAGPLVQCFNISASLPSAA
jgi:hypothetical protein